MYYEDLREYCLSLKGVTECFPFDEFSLVFKVQGKMFALLPLDNPETQIALKCDPERALQLREEYEAITPAYHFNKKHWNCVFVHLAISKDFMFELIRHSYDLVVDGLPKKLKEEL
jgi:predicted DNA-binding protein (MmcQ/YjbR family)